MSNVADLMAFGWTSSEFYTQSINAAMRIVMFR